MNAEDEKVLQPKIASREVTTHILKAFGLRMSKKLGQNFLIDADIALYRAKKLGRNRFEFFTRALEAEVVSAKRL